VMRVESVALSGSLFTPKHAGTCVAPKDGRCLHGVAHFSQKLA
jgi:hypothetical protein